MENPKVRIMYEGIPADCIPYDCGVGRLNKLSIDCGNLVAEYCIEVCIEEEAA